MRRGVLVGATLAALASGPASWMLTDHLESDNEFCVACHLPDGSPLHEQKAREFEEPVARSLVAAHRVNRLDFRCRDCHAGASFLGRLRVKAVSGLDTLRYAAGRFEEPGGMRHALWDEDCVQCHPTYESGRDDAFHAIEAHNTEFPHACVECHEAHPTRAARELNFLAREAVLPICRNCHEEF